MNYYNEFDPKAAAWLRELIKMGEIPEGEVDERSITDVRAEDLRGFTQCHFFAGIGGWNLALKRANIPATRPLWTGSCPCQAFSCAGKQEGFKDARDLWPVFHNLIRECRPDVVFGEQVENAVRHGWLDRLYADLEAEKYTVGSVVLGAHSAGAGHIRQRIYWMADAKLQCERPALRHEKGQIDAFGNCENGRMADSKCGGRQQQQILKSAGVQHEDAIEKKCALTIGVCDASSCGVADASDDGHASRDGLREASESPVETWKNDLGESSGSRNAGGMVDSFGERGRGGESGREDAADARQSGQARNFWSDATPHFCKDGKWRCFESRIFPLAHGVPRGVGHSGDPRSPEYVNSTTEARAMRLKGYGNAICVDTAVMFIEAAIHEIDNRLSIG